MAEHTTARRVDIHQHLWTEPLLDALATRDRVPYVSRERGLTVLHSAGELPYIIDSSTASASTAGLDLTLIALSSPIGIEALPREQADPLIDAHLDGVLAAGPHVAPWGPVPLDEPDAGDVDSVLARGAVGIQVPAGALAGPERLEGAWPILHRASERRVPVFVHPGRAPGQPAAATHLGEPIWWRALTDYPAQMQAAYFTFAAEGRRAHPELRIVFAMLAGGAPLLAERLPLRGGPQADLTDPLTFFDSSGYGPAALTATARLTGTAQLLYGSDRPVAEPVPTGREHELQARAAQFLDHRQEALA